MSKKFMGINVLEAAKQRIKDIFDNFELITISFSGGKDSTVLTHIVMEEAVKRKQKVALFFLDWECQFEETINHVRDIYNLYKDNIEPYWIQLEITTNNSTSMFEPLWKSWDENKKKLWLREKEIFSIKNKKYFEFYYDGITFEEFTPLFAKWYGRDKKTACFVGIRTVESLNRYRAMVRDDKNTYDNKKYTTKIVDDIFNVYPIYDWETSDIWIYNAKYNKCYNKLYDYMYKAGMSIHQMRIDEPLGEEARKNLWLFQIIEPKTWAKLIARMNGVNSGSLYCREKGNILGNISVDLPKGLTWKKFVLSILNTMPKTLSEHYKTKIAKYLYWYKERGYKDGIPDEANKKLENYEKVPSWRRVCKTILKNDYYCKGIGFSINKSSNYEKYMCLMRRKRKEWGLFDDFE
jgi:predicted phosphoadenosine phosphosulfate sulfurtransferase